MARLEETLVRFAKGKFNYSEGVTRFMYESVPGFMQDKLFQACLDCGLPEAGITTLFWGTSRQSEEGVFAVEAWNDILAIRNNSDIEKILVISERQLDKSNESSILILNPSASGQAWDWLNGPIWEELSAGLMSSGLDLGDGTKSLLQRLVTWVGKNYEDGISCQWEILSRLFEIGGQQVGGSNAICLALGVPDTGINRNIEDSLRVLDGRILPKRGQDRVDIYSELANLGILQFGDLVKERIAQLGALPEDEKQALLDSVNVKGFQFARFDALIECYRLRFEEFLASFSQTFMGSRGAYGEFLFKYLPKGVSAGNIPEWWRLLDCWFWELVCRPQRAVAPSARVLVSNRIAGSPKAKPFVLTNSILPGKVDWEIEGIEAGDSLEDVTPPGWEFEQGSVSKGKSIFENLMERAANMKFSLDSGAKIELKVLPVELFKAGVLPFISGEGIKAIPTFNSSPAKWSISLSVGSQGYHYLTFIVNEQVQFDDHAPLVYNETLDSLPLSPSESSDLIGVAYWQARPYIDIAEGETELELKYRFDGQDYIMAITISVDGDANEGVDSVYKALVLSHERKRTVSVSLATRDCLLDTLEGLFFENPDSSHKPVLLSVSKTSQGDFSDMRMANAEGWYSQIAGLDARTFIYRQDGTDIVFNDRLVSARIKIMEYIRKQAGQIEGVGILLRSMPLHAFGSEFEALLLEYISAYCDSLDPVNDPDGIARWFDVHPLALDVGARNAGVNLTSSDIVGLLLSPYHPLRLFWQWRAQTLLKSSRGVPGDTYEFCPAAGSLDPSIVPDMLSISLRQPTHDRAKLVFIALGNDSGYWGLLAKLESNIALLGSWIDLELFWNRLGLRISGLGQGLSPTQVERSLSEVSRMMVSKNKMDLALVGSRGGNEEHGILSWLKKSLGIDQPDDSSNSHERAWSGVHQRKIDIHDMRELDVQPTESQILEEYNQVGGNLKWYVARLGAGAVANNDLAILCDLRINQIESVEAEGISSPAMPGMLYKHRLVRNIRDAAMVPLKEQRKTGLISQNDPLLECFKKTIEQLEGVGENKTYISITPDIDALRTAMNAAHFSVVSSSLVSPATFSVLANGAAGRELYLWEFEMPSFNNSSNSKTGFYLLAHTEMEQLRRQIVSGLGKDLERFPEYSSLATEDIKLDLCKAFIREYMAKGLPSLKKLLYGGNFFRGEVGGIIALRQLQGKDLISGIFPVFEEADGRLNLIVAVDPFRDAVHRMPRENDDDDKKRPDFLAVSYARIADALEVRSKIRLTPIEIKFRSTLESAWGSHIVQASSFSRFLERILGQAKGNELWQVAFASILGRMAEYSLGLLSAAEVLHSRTLDKAMDLGYNLITEVVSGLKAVDLEIDERGRLIYIYMEPQGELPSIDQDVKLLVPNKHAGKLLFADSLPEVSLGNWFASGWGMKAILPPMSGIDPAIAKEEVSSNPVPKTTQGTGEQNTRLDVDEQDYRERGALETEFMKRGEGASVKEGDSIEGETPAAQNQILHTGVETMEFNEASYLAAFPEGLKFKVGRSTNAIGMKDYYFNPGSTKVNQLNIGVVGDLGTGKTQLLKSLIYQMSFNSLANRGKAPKFLILDTKRDYDGTGSELDAAFIEAIGAKVLLPYNLPINIFDIKGAKQLNPAYHRAQFFIDVLGKIYKGIGPVQRDNLRNAILASYTEKGYRDGANNAYIDFEAPTLKDVRDKYKELVGKVDSPLAIINSLIDQQLFTNVAADTMSFKDLFDRTIVVSLGLVAGTDESLRLLMVIFLKLYQEYMINIDKAPFLGHGDETLRKVDSFILIDEAKLIMDYGFPVLEDVLRKGREFGVGVILSTQYLSDYGRTDIDYRQPLSTWFIHKVPSLTVKDLKSIGITSATDDVVQKIQEAGKHFCLYKTVGVNGEFMRGTPLYELLRHRDNEDKTDL